MSWSVSEVKNVGALSFSHMDLREPVGHLLARALVVRARPLEDSNAAAFTLFLALCASIVPYHAVSSTLGAPIRTVSDSYQTSVVSAYVSTISCDCINVYIYIK